MPINPCDCDEPPQRIDLASLAASVNEQTTAVANFIDQQIEIFTTTDDFVTIYDAVGNPIVVPSWRNVASISGATVGAISEELTTILANQVTLQARLDADHDSVVTALTLSESAVQTVNTKPGPTVVLVTDDINEPSSSPAHLWFTNDRAIHAPLTGFDASNDDQLTNVDDVLSAAGKLQGQINNLSDKSVTKVTSRASTTVPLPTNIYSNGTSGVGATLTGMVLGALPTQDGVPMNVGDILLVMNEVNPANNGLYVVSQLGDVSSTYVLTRHSSMDQSDEFSGAVCFVGDEGASQGNTLWMVATLASYTVGSTPVIFSPLASGSGIQAARTVSYVSNDNYTLPIGMPVRIFNAAFYVAQGLPSACNAIGFVFNDEILAGNVGRAQIEGAVTLLASQWELVTGMPGGLAPGQIYYLSTDRGMTPFAPTADGQVVAPVGYAVSATEFVIDIGPVVYL